MSVLDLGAYRLSRDGATLKERERYYRSRRTGSEALWRVAFAWMAFLLGSALWWGYAL